MMAMAMMDLKVSQMQWMMVRYTGYASNAGGRTSKGMDFSDFFLQFVNFFANISFVFKPQTTAEQASENW